MNAETRDPHPHAGSENCLAIGTRLSDFEITGVLGEGGFGIVYVAYDHALQRTVAIKEYMPGALAMRAKGEDIALRAERHKETFQLGLKSFINEARLLAQFDHPSLVKVYRFWEQNNTAYTAMKFYDGRTIKDIVANSPEMVDEAWCRKVLRQIMEALEMLYTMKILHRDISPDNIIVQENGDAVLLDFGSARQIIGDTTRGLTVILKPGYAPVEQYAGDASLEQGPYTDLYALSAVMYFAIAKTPPPTSIGRMVNDPIVPLAKRAPAGYGAALLAAIDKGLAVLAPERPQTIAEFRALLGIAPQETPAAPPAARAPLPPARPAEPPAPASASASASEKPAKPAKSVKSVVAATRMPAWASKSAARPAADAAAKPSPQRRRLVVGASAAALLIVAIAGLYALVPSSGHDKSAAAQPPAPSSTAAASASAPGAPTAPVTPNAPGAPDAAPAAAEASASASVNVTVIGNVLDTESGALPTDFLTDVAPATTPAATPAQPDAKHPAPPPGANYKLHIKPWGTLYVDGKPRGVSPPLKQVTLTPGKHEIRIVNPSFPEHVTAIEVDKNNKPGTIEFDFSGARP